MNEARVILTQASVRAQYGWSRKKQWLLRKQKKLGYLWDNGRIAYLPKHIQDYLQSCERPAKAPKA